MRHSLLPEYLREAQHVCSCKNIHLVTQIHKYAYMICALFNTDHNPIAMRYGPYFTYELIGD